METTPITTQQSQSNQLEASKSLKEETLDTKPTITPLKKKRRLTAKQEGFIDIFLKTKNASEAVRQNYAPTTPDTVRAIATENLAKPSIQERIRTLKAQYIDDSFTAYEIQKQIMHKSSNDELVNKIANKIQDRAGFTPVYRQENKTMAVKYSITRDI